MFRVLSHRVCVLAHACNRSLSGNSRSVMVFRGYGNCKECQPVLVATFAGSDDLKIHLVR